jgi:hypothetical protein
MGDELTELLALLTPYGQHVGFLRGGKTDRPTLYVGRGKGKRGRYGNPHAMRNNTILERLRVVKAHFDELASMPSEERRAFLAPIKAHLENDGLLLCFCAPLPCHGMSLAYWALKEE